MADKNADVKAAEDQLRRIMTVFKKDKEVCATQQDLDRYLRIVSGEFICGLLEDDQESLLHQAADCCKHEFIKTLLKNIPQDDRLDLLLRRRKLNIHTYLHSLCNTALHRAIKSNHDDHEKTIDALLSPLTSVQKIELLSTHDSWGRTPTDLAQERGKKSISKYLNKQKPTETELMLLRSQVKTMKEEKAELKADRDRQQEEVTRMRKVIERTDAERQTERDRQEDEVNRLTDEIKRMQQEINRQHAVIHKGDGGGDGGFAGAGRDGEIVLGGGGGGECYDI